MKESSQQNFKSPSDLSGGFRKDFLISCFFGSVAAGANCAVPFPGTLFFALISVIALYFAVLCFPLRVGLMTTLIFILSIPYSAYPPWFTIRLSIFAMVLALTTTNRFSFAPILSPPFFTTTLLWILFFLVINQDTLHLGQDGSLHNINLTMLMSIEILTSVVIGLACCSRRINIFLGQNFRTVPITTWLTHVIALPFLAFIFFIGLFSVDLNGQPFLQSFSMLLASIKIQNPTILSLLALLAVFPVLAAVYLTHVIHKWIKQIRLCTESTNRLLAFNQEPSVLQEFQRTITDVRTEVDNLITELQSNKSVVKDLRLEVESVQKKLREKLQLIQNIGSLLDEAPWGFLGLTVDGLIVEASKKLCEFLKLNPAEAWEKDFETALRNQPWQQELRAILFQIFQDFTSYIGQMKRFYTSPHENSCLEILVFVHNEISLPSIRVQEEPSISRSDIGVSVYIRKISNTFDMQQRMLAPSLLDLLGGLAIDCTSHLEHNLKLLTERLTVIHADIWNGKDPSSLTRTSIEPLTSSDTSPNYSDRYAEILTALSEARQLTSASTEIIEYLAFLSSNKEEPLDRVSMNSLIQQGLNYLHDIAVFEHPLELTLPEFEKRRPSRASTGRIIIRESDLERAPEIHAKAPRSEVIKFVAFFLNFLKNVQPRAPEMEVSLANENIQSPAAQLIPGSHPGYYARITIAHRGRSITANMLSGKLQNVRLFGNESDSIEAALTMLHFQIKRLGGFLSVQSTATKGTTITIYIPAEEDSKAISKRKRQKQETLAMENLHTPSPANTVDSRSTTTMTAIAPDVEPQQQGED